ncbi:MAG: hypothetical protein KJ950_13765 [Proteobacteria bacterium]|nr:hypothetical protein [Pseudomonadota bacterium]MBU1686076.1 hypothetical protein [Pseudomonadota bacterium]
MDWEELLKLLKNNVKPGQITTYGNLSEFFYGARNAAQAIAAMLNAAVTADHQNRILTNRVVTTNGLIRIDGQKKQLQNEDISFRPDGRVDFQQHPPLRFEEDPQEENDPADIEIHSEQATAKPIHTSSSTAYTYFNEIIEQISQNPPAEFMHILREIIYEEGLFANKIVNAIQQRLANHFNTPEDDGIFNLIQLAEKHNQLMPGAINLAHTIRKERNLIIHNEIVPTELRGRNLIVLTAALLLWPQLP